MTCRECVTHQMAQCDLASNAKSQRCRECREMHGGYQIHNHATKKLMIMQAATQMLLFFGPRAENEKPETFDEHMLRRRCIQAVVEEGYKKALEINVEFDRSIECRCNDSENLMSKCWTIWASKETDHDSTGYAPAAITGRLLLKMCEAEAQLENFTVAAELATRAADILSTLDRGRTNAAGKQIRSIKNPAVLAFNAHTHPARQLIIPARQIAKQMKEKANAGARAVGASKEGGKEKKGGGKQTKKKDKGKGKKKR